MTILINLFSLLWLVLVMEVMEVAGEKFPKLVWVYW